MSKLKRLVHEIHRRSLWQVLGIYLVGAWVAYEVIQSLTEGLGLPQWFPPFAVVLFIIGLPIVLATAFVQEGVGRSEPQVAAAEPAGVGVPTADAAERVSVPAATAGRQAQGVRRLLTWRNALGGGVLALALWGVVAAGWLLVGGVAKRPEVETANPLRADVVAVLPFRVAGADASVEYLREGMVDLLAAKLTGEGGPRAVDPRAAVSAWRRAAGAGESEITEEVALEVARGLGAGRLLLGGLVGTASHVVINATVLSAADGAVAAKASVEGSTDSLTALVDRLTAELLVGQAGEARQRLAALTSTSLPALRAYLDGQAAYRRGSFVDAESQFRQAVELDSTFALAALGLVSARYWTVNGIDPVSVAIAWNHRDRLSERDRSLLTGLAGPNFPEPSTRLEFLTAAERAAEAAPDRPEAWYWLGEAYYHGGSMLGLATPFQLAQDAFSRAFQLDSTFAAPLSHLVDLAVLSGDHEGAHALLPLYLAVDTTGEFRDYMEWQEAVAFGDSLKLDSLRTAFAEMATIGLRAVVRQSVLRGIAQDDAELAAAILRERSGTRGERFATQLLLHDWELDRGRPSRALAAVEAIRPVQPEQRLHLRLRLLDALYGGGDQDAGIRAMAELASSADGPLVEGAGNRALQYADICVVEQWRIWQGDRGSARRSIGRLRGASAPADSIQTVEFAQTCAELLEAMLAVVEERSDAGVTVARLDDHLQTAPPGVYPHLRLDRVANLVAARMLETLGEVEAAYRAVQRREYFLTRYLTSHLREEGRLAARLGRRDEAIRAYRHYLTLRSDPEPALLAEVDQVRAELDRLSREASP